MDIKFAKLLINETRKSLEKLHAAEQKVIARNDENTFCDPLMFDSGFQEAAQEIKLFVRQLEILTDVKFTDVAGAYITSAATAEFVEINLQAIEHLIEVLSYQHNDAPEQNENL